MKKLLECVPNFSEGRNMVIIEKIIAEIKSIEGLDLLDVDSGKATNRTVITFVGQPEDVVNAAFLAIKKATELIDMRNHKGAHPRFGATDVCPLIPVANISMEETVEFARLLAHKVGTELRIPVYCYENAAFQPERKNLAFCRSGEYEGLQSKLSKPVWKPDYGPASFLPKTGAIAIGARNFLIAYNINLNTTSVRRANAVAFDVREAGRIKPGTTSSNDTNTDNNSIPSDRIPGTLKAVKAIGWYIEEYGIAQISMNLTDINITSIHQAFDEVCKKATERGLRVTGSELVGVVPLKTLLDAGKHYLKQQQRSLGIPDNEIIKIAIKSLGLNELYIFEPEKKIIEYRIEKKQKNSLTQLSLNSFIERIASESPAPGGGSVAACLGAMGIALGTMVANLSAHKKGWDNRWEEFSQWAEKGKNYQNKLIKLIDEDTTAFNQLMEAFSLPKDSEEKIELRNQAIQQATKEAARVPLKVMQICKEAMQIVKNMAITGNPNSVSDTGVGAYALRSSAMGAFLNVKINVKSLKDKTFALNLIGEGETIIKEINNLEKQISEIIEKQIFL